MREPLGIKTGSIPSQVTHREAGSASQGLGFKKAKLISRKAGNESGIHHITLEIDGNTKIDALSHVDVMIPNDRQAVQKGLKALRLDGSEPIRSELSALATFSTARDYLTEFVDLDSPFLRTDWVSSLGLHGQKSHSMKTSSLQKSLSLLPLDWRAKVDLHTLLEAMPIKSPKTYSVASVPSEEVTSRRKSTIELLIQPRQGGLASNFFQTAPLQSKLRLLSRSASTEHLLKATDHPVICFATGSGFAPILSLLQHRLQESRRADESNTSRPNSITLILGFHKQDTDLFAGLLRQPLAEGIVDKLLMTPSNPEKARPQDKLFEATIRGQIDRMIKIERPFVFVCASPSAAEDFGGNLNAIVGCDVKAALGERYVEEVFKPAT